MPPNYPDTVERTYVPVDVAPITPSNGGRLDSVAASSGVGVIPGLSYTAVTPGTGGNAYSVNYEDSAGAAASASLAGNDITVSAPVDGKAATLILDAGAGEVVITADNAGSEYNGINVSLIKPVTIASGALSVVAVSPRDFKVYLATDASTDVFATLSTALTGNNNDLDFTSLLEGAYGNGITIQYLDPGLPSQSLRVITENKAIKVYLATGAGTKQVETATAAGTITTSGTASAVVTGAFITGSPITVEFEVEEDDTASLWAEKARLALINDRRVSQFVDIGGTTTAITGTRKTAAANDATFNIALADVDSVGITEAATSANTTAGVAPAITSTAAQVKAAIEAHKTASLLVTVANKAANDGTGVVTALAATNLASGKHADATSTVAQIVTAINALAATDNLITASGTGTTSTVVNANYSGTLAGGIDAGKVRIRDIAQAILADEDSAAVITPVFDLKDGDNLVDGSAWPDTDVLAGGIDGQWDLPQGFARGLYVENAGDVIVYTNTGEERTIPVPNNASIDIAITGVKATGTTATGIYGRA